MRADPQTLTFASPRGFVVLEGVNGAGKSTLLRGLVAALQTAGHTVTATREPGGSGVGEAIRALLLTPREPKLEERTELLLFGADRAEHVTKIIRPALARGELVLSDRYLYSTQVFQGYGRNVDRQLITTINAIAIDGMLPDFVVLLDLDAAAGLRRSARRNASEPDAFESEALAFHERIRQGFLEVASADRTPFIIVDAQNDAATILQQLQPLFERWANQVRHHHHSKGRV